MTTLLFVRHGETDWNRQGRLQGSRDIPLNESGRNQARALAETWSWGGEVLMTSPQSRARETAEILASARGLVPLPPDPRLVERSFGDAEGLTVDQRRARFPDDVITGREPAEAVAARARSFLDDVTRHHPGRRVVVVSHGGFINAVLALVSGGAVGTGKTLLGNASVSEVFLGVDGWRVGAVGVTLGAEALGLRE